MSFYERNFKGNINGKPTGFASKSLIPRQTGLILGLDKIQAIIGSRRVGKISTMILALKELKEKRNIPVNQLFYFNFAVLELFMTITFIIIPMLLLNVILSFMRMDASHYQYRLVGHWLTRSRETKG